MGLEMWINRIGTQTTDVGHINEVILYNHYKKKNIPTPKEAQEYIQEKGWTKEKDSLKINEYLETIRKERYSYESLISLYEKEDPGYENVAFWARNYLLNAVMENFCFERGAEVEDLNGLKTILNKEEIEEIGEKFKQKLLNRDIKDNIIEKAMEPFEKILKETDFEKETLYYSSCW